MHPGNVGQVPAQAISVVELVAVVQIVVEGQAFFDDLFLEQRVHYYCANTGFFQLFNRLNVFGER